VGVRAFDEGNRFQSTFDPPSPSLKQQINTSDKQQTNNMCGSDIFLGFLAILFPPIAGE